MYTWYTYIYTFISIRLYVESSWSVSRAFSDNYTTAKFSNVRSTRFVNRLGDVRFDGQSIKRVSRGFARILLPVSAMFRYTCSLHANTFATAKSRIKWSFRIFAPRTNRNFELLIVLISGPIIPDLVWYLLRQIGANLFRDRFWIIIEEIDLCSSCSCWISSCI